MHKTKQLVFIPRCITLLLLQLLCSSLVDEGSAVKLPSRLDPTSEVLLQLKRYREAAQNPVYSNDWAVQVYGGVEVADDVAALHGFINMGKVKILVKFSTSMQLVAYS